MPAIDFPAAPAVNDEYSFEGRTWRWNGTGWEVKEYPAALLAGTAANPSLYFSGDPNTGLYSPGADQLAVATNGTGRLFVDASGRVGIGTSSQEQQLTILNNSTSVASGSTLTVGGGTFNTGGEGGSIAFSNTVKTGITHAARIRSGLIFLGAQESGDLIFDTNGGAGLTERLRITSAGLVGIGTSSPGERLTVAGNISLSAAQPYISLIDSVWGVGSTFRSGVNTLGTATGDYQLFNVPTGKGFAFAQNNATNSLVIDPSGRVGIGTTSPSNLLHVFNGANSGVSALISAENNHTLRLARVAPAASPGNFDLQVTSNGAGNVIADNSLVLQSGTNAPITLNTGGASERARID